MKIWTEMDINRVYIMMGFACNFHCKYCIQEGQTNCIKAPTEVSDSLINYLKRLHDIRPNIKKNITIMFWGGEPLIYFNTIKEIIGKLDGYNFDYGTVTNGALLTEEIVDYFNAHKISVAISNDGLNTKHTRINNVLENKQLVNLIKKLDNVVINSVISAYNQDLLAFSQYVQSIFKDKAVGTNWEWLMCGEHTPKDLYDIDLDKFEIDIKRFFDKCKQDLLSGQLSSEILFIKPYLNRIALNNSGLVDLYPACSPVRHTMNIDLAGNCYACHPAPKIGNVSTAHSDMLDIYQKEFNHAFTYADCSQCEYVLLCKAGCPLETACDGKIHMCKAKRIFYKELFSFVESFGGKL